MTIRINGRSLATAVLARCLQIKGAGFVLAEEAAKPVPGPKYICINDVAISLLRDLYPGLWADGGPPGHGLESREVIWGSDPVPQRIGQEALVVDVDALTSRMFSLLDKVEPDDGSRPVTWQVNPDADAAKELKTGDRVMLTARVALTQPLEPARSVIESLMDGWMFLAPIDAENGILQAMVPKPPADPASRLQEFLAQSTLLAPYVGQLGPVGVFPAAPAIRLPMAGPAGIFVGGKGVRLDPVSGEGAPFAIRTAVLAAAVLTHDGSVDEAAAHYRHRILKSFLSHLSGCQTFYADAFSADSDWQLELRKSGITRSMMESAIAGMEGSVPPLRLEGLTLVAPSVAAQSRFG